MTPRDESRNWRLRPKLSSTLTPRLHERSLGGTSRMRRLILLETPSPGPRSRERGPPSSPRGSA